MRGVTVVSDNDAWAVGTSEVIDPGGVPIIQHWDGTSWNNISSPIPDPTRTYLAATTAIASANVWLVGAYYTENSTPNCSVAGGQTQVQCTLVEQWNGSSWSIVTSPNAHNGQAKGNALNAVTVRSTNPSYHDIVAVGDTTIGDSDKTLVEYRHDASSSWEVMDTTPLDTYYSNQLFGVASDSQGEMWVVGDGYGFTGGRYPIIGYYSPNNGGWQVPQIQMPNNSDAFLSSVDVFAPTDVWAVGAYEVNNIYYPLIEHWDGGTKWQYADNLPNVTGFLSGVFVTKERDVWAVGSQGGSPLVMHWHGSSLDDRSSWDVMPTQNPGGNNQLFAVATLPGSISGPITSAWAVGSSDNNTLIENIKAPVTTPFPSTNYFVETINPDTHYKKGCNAGNRLESGVIVLDYGKPKDLGDGIYGTLILDGQTKVTTDQITKAVENFADGYHDGRFGTNQQKCPSEPGPQTGPISIAVGINNDNRDGQASLTYQHANAWKNMVKNIQAYIYNKRYSEMSIVAAIDAEENWSNYSDAITWATNYLFNQVSTLYNYGSIDSYPCDDHTRIPNPPFSGGCTGWKIYQFYSISWGLGARPLPEIYHTLDARYWYLVKRWGIDNNQGSMSFLGETTHWLSCGCDYTPTQAWQVFWLELNQDAQTVQNLLSTDFNDMPQQ